MIKLGALISLALVLVLGAILYFTLQSSADAPTSKTSPQMLALAEFPSDLPVVDLGPGFQASDAASGTPQGNALELYTSMMKHYSANQVMLEGSKPSAAVVDKLTTLLIEASRAPYAGQGFLDDQVSDAPGASSEIDVAMEVIPVVVLNKAASDKIDEKSHDVASAVWITGRRAFEKGHRLHVRRQGLNMMQHAGSVLYELHRDEPEKLAAFGKWGSAISSIIRQWDGKIQLIQNVRQPIGDLLNIAQNDEDLSFRVSAISWLGIAKFNPGHQGNKNAILALIEKSKTSDEPLIAKAAQTADAFSIEDLRKLR